MSYHYHNPRKKPTEIRLPQNLPQTHHRDQQINSWRKALWQALKESMGKVKGSNGTSINAINQFSAELEKLSQNKNQVIIFNNQQIRIDINLGEAVYAVIEQMGNYQHEKNSTIAVNINEMVDCIWSKGMPLKTAVQAIEKKIFERAKKYGFTDSAASKRLGINISTYRKKCQQYGIK